MVPVLSITKPEQVRHSIVLQILSGELKPGQRLLESKLSRELGVSQATVNSALQDLHNQGLVTKVLNRSTNVSRYTRDEIVKLFAVRLVLEPAAADAAARRWSAEGKDRLCEHVSAMRRAAQARNIPAFCMADYAFHQEVYRLSGNSFLYQACQAIAAAPFAYVLCDHLQALPTDYNVLAENHQEIVEAMQEGPEAAVQMTAERVRLWLSHSLRALDSLPGGLVTP